MREQYQVLCRKLRGHDAYYGVTGNGRSLARFHDAVKRIWRKWLNRRSRTPGLSWEKFLRLLKVYPFHRLELFTALMQRNHNLRNRMRELRSSGSVGAPSGNRRLYSQINALFNP